MINEKGGTMLNKIRDKKGARKRKKLLGRGIGSGKGKTSGRGGKGQTARSGVSLLGFEGGQMPLYRRLPKRGFKNINRLSYDVINVSDIEKLITAKVLNPENITVANLMDVKSKKSKIKLLGKGDVSTKFNIEVDAVSKSALEKVKGKGGTVKVVISNDKMIADRKDKANAKSKTV